MSSEEPLECRRHYREELLQRAWRTAYQVADILYRDFKATDVAVFGSLAGQSRFSKHSDIDILVSGLPSDTYFRAVAETIGFSEEFRIHLARAESCKGHFRRRVLEQAVPIQMTETGLHRRQAFVSERGVTGTMNMDQLIQRISDDRKKMEGAVERIAAALENISDVPARYRRSIELAVARYLYDFYKQLENVFQRIAREVDQEVPTGGEWHKDLLAQMAAPRATRGRVISEETCAELQGLLGVHLAFMSVYADELDYERTLENAERVHQIFPKVSEELEAFIATLKTQEND